MRGRDQRAERTAQPRYAASSPVRELGVPESTAPPDQRRREARSRRVAAADLRRNLRPTLCNVGRGSRPIDPDPDPPPDEEEGEIEEFFGQLWFIPTSSRQDRVPPAAQTPRAAWIRRDRWETREFGPGDCFPVRPGEQIRGDPKQLNAADCWTKGRRPSFVEALMAGRGRGRGPWRGPAAGGGDGGWGGGGGDGGWGGGGGWNPQFHVPFYPQGPPTFQAGPLGPPAPFGYYQPPPPPFQSAPRPRPPGQHRPRPLASRHHPQPGDAQKNKALEKQTEKQSTTNEDSRPNNKALKVTCFNCNNPGHYSTECAKDRQCFICRSGDHLVSDCPEWKKPRASAQYLGSANKGLGFFHIEVPGDEENNNLWEKFENCAVLTVEEGEMEQEALLGSLREIFDKDWPWQLKPLDEYKYLVKFPPHTKLSDKIISKVTYFYLNNDGVLGSLRIWDGEFEPIGKLEEVWVQVRGIPPKWCGWPVFQKIASTLGKLSGIDWPSLFASYFGMVRLKVKCKNPARIPKKRVIEIADNLYIIHFKVEGDIIQEDSEDPEDGDGEEGGDDENQNTESNRESNMDTETQSRTPKANFDMQNIKGGSNIGEQKGAKTVPLWTNLFQGGDTESLAPEELPQWAGTNLLREMELAQSDQEEEMEALSEAEQHEVLPIGVLDVVVKERQDGQAGQLSWREVEREEEGLPDVWPDVNSNNIEESSVVQREKQTEQTQAKLHQGNQNNKRGGTKQRWGPIVPQKKSARNCEDGGTMLQRAQAIKMKQNLETIAELQVAKLWANLAVHARNAEELDDPLSNGSNGGICRLAQTCGVACPEARGDLLGG